MDLTKWSGCIRSFVYIKHEYFVTTHKQTSQMMHYCKNQSQTFTITVFPQFVTAGGRRLSHFFFSRSVFVSHLSVSLPLSHSQTCPQSLCDNLKGALCKFRLRGHYFLSLNEDPSPLPPVSALFSRLDCRPSGGGIDCHRRMTESWPARFLWSRCLRVCPGIIEACWSLP